MAFFRVNLTRTVERTADVVQSTVLHITADDAAAAEEIAEAAIARNLLDEMNLQWTDADEPDYYDDVTGEPDVDGIYRMRTITMEEIQEKETE